MVKSYEGESSDLARFFIGVIFFTKGTGEMEEGLLLLRLESLMFFWDEDRLRGVVSYGGVRRPSI